MRKTALKTIISLLALKEARGLRLRLSWDHVVLLGSTAVTCGLLTLFAYGKVTGRW
jgi:hypothetical protein